jgi:hypothetical protein
MLMDCGLGLDARETRVTLPLPFDPMTAKEKLRERVEDLTEQEAEATLEFIAARGQSFGDWLDSRPEDDEPLSSEEDAALAASDADIAAGRIVSYAQVKQNLGAE